MMINLSDKLDKLDKLDSFEAKKNMMSFFNDIKLNTFVISYLGQIRLEECDKYIDSMNLYSSGSSGIVINMMAASKNITIDFLQSFETDKYINALIKIMEEVELDFSISEKIEFKTPEDSCYEEYQED